MNIIVKTGEELNAERTADGLLNKLLNDSALLHEEHDQHAHDHEHGNEHSHEHEEWHSHLNMTSRRLSKIHNLSELIGSMSIMNLSGGDTPIVLEMSIMANGMAIKEDVNPLRPADVKLAFQSPFYMFIGILVLMGFIVNGAMVGPLTVSLPAKSPLVRATWRTQASLCIGIPLMILLYIWKSTELDYRRDFSPKMLVNGAITGLFNFLWYVGLVVGCSMTVTSHAMVMYSSSGLYMLFYAILIGSMIHRFEWYGWGLFFFGVLCLLLDPYAVKAEGSGYEYLGDLVTFISSGFGGAMLGVYNARNSKIIHPLVILMQTLFFSVICQITFACFMLGPERVLSFDVEYGAFGWWSDSSIIAWMLLVVGPFNGLMMNICFLISYYFFPMEIIAGAILTQPFLSQIFGVLFGQDKIPGFLTMFGLIIIAGGSFVSGYGVRMKAAEQVQKIAAEEHIPMKPHHTELKEIEEIAEESF